MRRAEVRRVHESPLMSRCLLLRWRLVGPVLALAIAVTPGVGAGAQPNPSPVVVQSVTQPISGCPPGSIAQIISPDHQAFTMLFDEFVAEVGPVADPSDGTKGCLINVTLKAPEGKSVAVVELDYRGFVSLDAGVVAWLTATFDSLKHRDDDDEGLHPVTALAKRFTGPRIGDYTLRIKIPAKEVRWSSCDGTGDLRIHVVLAVRGAGQGLVTLDSLDGQVVQEGPGNLKFKVELRPCP